MSWRKVTAPHKSSDLQKTKIEVIIKSGRCGVMFQGLKETDSSQDTQIQSSPGKTVRI